MMASASLQEFVKEHKKAKGGGGILSSFDLTTSTSSNGASGALSDIRTKISSTFSNVVPSTTSLPSFLRFNGNSSQNQDGDGLLANEDGVPTPITVANGSRKRSSSATSNGGGGSIWTMLRNDEDTFGLSRTQRIVGFFFCFICGLLCFGLAALYLPIILIAARKFAALNTLGSVCFLFSFALLWGPKAYLAHLFSKPRLPVTLAYLGSVIATLYSSLWISSTVLTIVFACVQAFALIWFVTKFSNFRCRCVCPDLASVGLNQTDQRYYTDTNQTNCGTGVVLQQLEAKYGKEVVKNNSKYAQFSEKCYCKPETRNTGMIKVVVIFVICVITLLVTYMVFLLFLDPVFRRQGIRYETQVDEVSSNIFDPVNQDFPRRISEDGQDEEQLRREDGEPGTSSSVNAATILKPRHSTGASKVMTKVETEQHKWLRKVEEQRKNIFTHHTMLN